ncbi:hypothetical protein N431DRAFT_460170 [Stipitochalara longipes BDJ]|nr:hypothetical protein N431DRAFT_460170 [Stipitochalara longipes BDJ]
MKAEYLPRLLAVVAPMLSIAHGLAPPEIPRILSRPLPTPKLEAEPEVTTTVFVYVPAPSTSSLPAPTSNSFITITTLAPVSPLPTTSAIIYTATESWSIRIWPPWFRTTQIAVPSSAPKPSSGSREGI